MEPSSRLGGTVIYQNAYRSVYGHSFRSIPGSSVSSYWPFLFWVESRVTRPNQAWAADITYLPMAREFLYLVAIMVRWTRLVGQLVR